MSTIVCFDIRYFSTHMSHLLAEEKNANKKVFRVVKNIFAGLEKAITTTSGSLETHVIHTGDGFVAVFYGRERCLQGLQVAALVANMASNILDDYNRGAKPLKTGESLPPLGYGIGIHLGAVRHQFPFRQVYPLKKTGGLGIGLVGHAINVASRVQETTKDHTSEIICTKQVRTEAIDAVVAKKRTKVKKSFKSLGTHKFRGIKKSVTLYGVDRNLAKILAR